MIIYSFIPILSIYAGWRIQKFWLLAGINLVIGIGVGFVFGLAFGGAGGYLSLVVLIPVSVLIVRHYAKAYNAKIAASAPS